VFLPGGPLLFERQQDQKHKEKDTDRLVTSASKQCPTSVFLFPYLSFLSLGRARHKTRNGLLQCWRMDGNAVLKVTENYS